MFNIDSDKVRAKNKDLLLTDKITDEEVNQAIDDAKQLVLTTTYERFNVTISDNQFTDSMNLAVKLYAASSLIKDNYQNQNGLELASQYAAEAKLLCQSIVKGKELQSVTGIDEYDKPRSYASNIDTRANDFSTVLKNNYR